MKKGKGEGEGEGGGNFTIKIGVSSMDADFYRTTCLVNLILIFWAIKHSGSIPCGEKF
jgi:hypothetical protein